ncbi:solute:Na+ symporter, SSS family [Planifilum fulgidum]|jgi:solute:Na+ symporter, SSS family|uniref:Solute:Na+ symporter, SSS family n=1 Tax=Planifilum fulgidum TaxID=201973 RepID=A0A1I2SLG9_9BACL|nr:sodium:solute symporter family protein [Planifilum fulgidum]MBO2497905.1 sodium:solute symporter family protein [Bacillota bacterium]MBO2533525.1 sodium:solute symporter family protein [Thermoactinomycetaceae bacterium]SFG53574.1 solute:Na+ symporter, SSS family [Planifilum fulgidum]
MNLPLLIVMIIVYMAIMSWLAYLGNKQTKTAEDYLVAGRRIHPLVMALSYGATFISTSAIIGFGGASALYGFGMLWLAFLNILVGIFVAFAVFGVRLRKMSSALGATTFPTLLGERYQSKFITVFSGLMIFLFMPAYTSIVLIGGGRFLQETLKVDFNIGLMLLAIIVGLYVITGGLKAVMYTDAFCALVMMAGMVFLLFNSYSAVGGVMDGHEGLSAMRDLVPQALAEQGHRGWTAMPEFGSPLWWTLVSTLIMGVGIGVLAQPQLAMRAMTVTDDRALYRAVLIGGVFMFFMTGTAFMAGPLSNLYFYETQGKISVDVAGGNIDLIMPIFINQIMPEWFLYLFTLTLLSAAISTISSLIHVQGAAFGEDILKTLGVKSAKGSLNLSKIGVLVGVVAAVILAYILPGSVIAQATAFWFGICASGFLPALIGALYWRNATRAGAAASIVTGFAVSIFGFLFLHQKEAAAIGLCEALFGKETLLPYPWTHVDPLFYAFPLAAVVFVAVSWMTRSSIAPVREQIQRSFADAGKM